jgi:hypothetical protein
MIDIRDRVIRLFITIAISAIICILVTLCSTGEEVELMFVLKSMLLGSVIWIVSEFSSELVEKLWPHNIVPMYIVLSIIIIGGTSLGLVILNKKSIVLIVIVCAVAEIIGLLIAICSREIYKKKLNKQLEEFKKEIEIK